MKLPKLLNPYSFRQLARQAIYIAAAITIAGGLGGTRAFADTCPTGMSQLDCAAIYGNWPNWVPDNGSSSCGQATTASGTANTALSLDGNQVANAKIVIGIAKTENLGQGGAVVGLMVALDESHLKIYANSNVPLSLNSPNKQATGSDHDSLGIFQQRISTAWSTISNDPNNQTAVNQLMDPAYNAEAFFGSPAGATASSSLKKGLQNVNGWQTMDPWVAAQRVQVSGDSSGLNYKQFLSQAQSIIAQYYDSSPAVPLPVPFSGAGSGTTASAAGACAATGVVAGSIVKTALGLAWPSGGHGTQKSDATQAYQTTMPTALGADPGNDAWSDCGVFVATVMRSSGADPSYFKRGTPSQISYLQQHSTMYKDLGVVTSSAQVQPGDIFINSSHTFIYVGKQPSGNEVTEASWGDHVPQLDNPLYFTNLGENFHAFRLIKQGP